MPAPTNISFATAQDLGTLPVSLTVDTRFAGVNYTLYYSITPTVAGELGVYAKGVPFATATDTYQPRVRVFDDQEALYLSLDATNIPLQMPVSAATLYYLQIRSPYGNVPTTAVLNLEMELFEELSVAAGYIAITDDTAGLPLALLSPSDGSPRKFVQPFPNGEQGIILPPTGNMCVEDADVGNVKIYSSTFAFIATPAITFTGNIVISSNGVDTWYVADSAAGASTIRTVDEAGAVGATTWNVGAGVGLTAMAPNLAETILYYNDATGSSSIVKKWDLVGDASLGTFAASIANYLVHDILNVADGTFLISYQKNSATKDLKVLRYNAAGTVLNTYNFGSDIASFDQRMCLALDDPNSFWMWIHQLAETGVSRFINIKLSDGSTLADFEAVTYESGMYGAAPVDPPLARFGHSNSCPIMVLRKGFYTTYPIRRLRRGPFA